MHQRDSLEVKVITTNSELDWESYKKARNSTNNAIRLAKKNYFTSNPRKTWQLINELNSRKSTKSQNISELKFGEQKITSPSDIAESFNDHFTNISQTLANDLPSSTLNQNSI